MSPIQYDTPKNDPFTGGLAQVDLSDGVNGYTDTRFQKIVSSRNLGGPVVNPGQLQRSRDIELGMLRAANPFVPIVILPNASRAVVLAAAVAQDLPIPDGAKYMVLNSTADYWLSVNGTAAVPIATLLDNAPMFKPNGLFFFIQGLQNVSLVSTPGAIVSAMFYFQQ